MLPRFLLGLLLLPLLGAATAAHAQGAHHSDANPLTEGWTLEPGDGASGGSAVSPDPDFSGVSAWQITAPAGAHRYNLPGPAPATSWTLRARMRVVNLNDAVDANVLVEVADGARRWLITFGSEADGDTVMTFSGGGTFVLPAAQLGRTDYFVIEIVHDGTDADVFVNGVEQESGWTGIAAGGIQRVNFGDGQTSSSGTGRYEDVEFVLGPQACRDGIDNDGDGLTDFLEVDPDCASDNDPTENAADHDRDGMRDGFEDVFGYDPTDWDEDLNLRVDGQDDDDADGLGNAAEQAAGTDPGNADTDLDTLPDGVELGGGSFGPQQVISNLATNARSVFAADVDGDGDTDVLSASAFDDKIAWYENTDGAGSFGPQQVISNLADFASSVFAADLDGDGDTDVLSASSLDSKIAWYENTDGAGSFGPQHVISTLALQANSVFAADVDGDGDIDVLSASFDDKIAWYENIGGAGSFGPQHVISTLADGANSVFAADVDGDGDIDVLSSSFSDDEIAWYENTDAAGSFGPQQVISTLADSAQSVFAADVDGDGDIDVLSASFNDDEIAWYENTDGAGSFGPQQVISNLADFASSVFAADLDGDGDTDVLSASTGDDEIAWYENTDGAGSFGPQQVISNLADGATLVFAADVDGDGDTDVLSASQVDDGIAWYPHANLANPLDPDSDDDGANDAIEVAAGTDPLDPLDFPGPPVPALSLTALGALALSLFGATRWVRRRG